MGSDDLTTILNCHYPHTWVGKRFVATIFVSKDLLSQGFNDDMHTFSFILTRRADWVAE